MLEKLKTFLAKLNPKEQEEFLAGIEESLKNLEVGDGQPVPPSVEEPTSGSLLGDDEEMRHEEIYDQSTGVLTTGPVRRKRSELNLGILLAVAALSCALPARAQLSCPAGLQAINTMSMRGSDDNIYNLMCWDPVNKSVTFPNLTAGFTFSGPLTTGALTPAAVTDGFAFGSEDLCQLAVVSGTAFTAGPAIVRAATNNLVLQATTNTTAGVVAATCDLSPLLARTTANKGATIKSVDLYYGVQTTGLSSIAAATPTSVAYPATGAAAAGTVAAIGGTLTVTPGTLQLATTTSGQCYHENISFGTTVAVNSNIQKLTVEQQFTTAGTTATILQICGVGINYNYQY